MLYDKHIGFVVGPTSIEIVKLVPPVLAVTRGEPSTNEDWVSQVTDSFVPRESSRVRSIWLLAVTAVVLTWTVVAAAAMTTEPAAAAAHTAGLAEDEQFVSVPLVALSIFPMFTVPVTVSFPVITNPSGGAAPPGLISLKSLSVLVNTPFAVHPGTGAPEPLQDGTLLSTIEFWQRPLARP
jgi:hypothetical protein